MFHLIILVREKPRWNRLENNHVLFLEASLWQMTERPSGARGHLLVDVRDGVHPAADAHLVPDVGGVTELVDDADVIGVGATEQLLLQR